MFLIITAIISVLVCINFLLLIFSCNKTTKRIKRNSEVEVIKVKPTISQQSSRQLAPTGS